MFSGLALTIYAAIFFVVANLLYFFVSRSSHRDKVVRKFELFLDEFDDYDRRAVVLNSIATEFVNSLGTDGAKALYEMRQIQSQLQNYRDEIDELLTDGGFSSAKRADLLIDEITAPSLQIMFEEDDDIDLPFGSNQAHWQTMLEERIQFIGEKIYLVCSDFERLGIAPSRNGKNVYDYLADAEISDPRF